MKTAYAGKVARINLTTGEIKVEQLDMDLAKKFIPMCFGELYYLDCYVRYQLIQKFHFLIFLKRQQYLKVVYQVLWSLYRPKRLIKVCQN